MTNHVDSTSNRITIEVSNTPREGTVWLTTGIALGVVLGTIISWLLTSRVERLAEWVDAALDLLLAGAVGFLIALAIATLLLPLLISRLLGKARGSLNQVVDEAVAAVEGTARRDTSSALSHTQQALHEAVAWYAPIMARRFIVQTALGLLIVLSGLIGTALLFRQTLLLGEQNEKLSQQSILLKQQNESINIQTATSDMQRRASLVAQLYFITEKVAEHSSSSRSHVNAPRPLDKTQPLELTDELIARIVSFTNTATPYWAVEFDRDSEKTSSKIEPYYADRKRSPERGQLLQGLRVLNVDTKALATRGATFEFADLREAVLDEANLSGARLNWADLRRATLSKSLLNRTNFWHADLGETSLSYASLIDAQLNGAVLIKANMMNANLRDANLMNANLNNATLTNANLWGATLSDANLSEANLSGADLTAANLRGADLRLTIIGENTPKGIVNRTKNFIYDRNIWREITLEAHIRLWPINEDYQSKVE